MHPGDDHENVAKGTFGGVAIRGLWQAVQVRLPSGNKLTYEVRSSERPTISGGKISVGWATEDAYVIPI